MKGTFLQYYSERELYPVYVECSCCETASPRSSNMVVQSTVSRQQEHPKTLFPAVNVQEMLQNEENPPKVENPPQAESNPPVEDTVENLPPVVPNNPQDAARKFSIRERVESMGLTFPSDAGHNALPAWPEDTDLFEHLFVAP